MSLLKSYGTLLKSSPLARTISWILFITLAIAIVGITNVKIKRKPSIQSISPLIGTPGDEITIKGSGFGETKGTSYVEIAGSKITSSKYLLWSDSEIKLILPDNVQDGLVLVGTSAGRSEPTFFANESGIPVAVRELPGSSLPLISSISQDNVTIGQTIKISGANFGNSRGNSKVYWTANRENVAQNHQEQLSEQNEIESIYIPANDLEFDYISWSDSEITLKVPDGATSGSIFIETSHGSSANKKISVQFPTGKKQYSNKRTYVIQLTADISNHVASQESTILLYIPKPAISSFQPYSELNEIYPEPFIADDVYDVIHKKQLNQITNNKQRFSQTYIVSSYSVKSNINPKAITSYKDKSSLFYIRNTREDDLIPSNTQAIQSLLETIIGNEKNPYRQASLIYNYLIQNYDILTKIRTGDVHPQDLIRRKKGDAYDFAIIFTALCRAAQIPAIPIGGVLVHDKSTVVPHWWTEIYFENYGWFPVDVALGAGLPFVQFVEIKNPKEFYFGNMDNQHIAFSRGYHKIKQSIINSKIVYRPRTYALQSLWEEAADATSSYSSLWNNPVIQGIY